VKEEIIASKEGENINLGFESPNTKVFNFV
jgi:hypothetical protein